MRAQPVCDGHKLFQREVLWAQIRIYAQQRQLLRCNEVAHTGYVQREFEEFLQCGRLEHGFLRVRCESCHAEHLVAFSCKRRGFCPSCGARRMAESAALLVDEVLPEQPMRQWVLSFPFQLRFLFGVVCGKGRNPTLRLWPAIFSGEIDVFPGDRRSRLISSMTSVAPA